MQEGNNNPDISVSRTSDTSNLNCTEYWALPTCANLSLLLKNTKAYKKRTLKSITTLTRLMH